MAEEESVMDEQNQSKEPVRRIRVGNVTAAVWVNENGYSVTLQKSYKSDDGTWQNTSSLWHADMVCAIKALERAEYYVHQQVNLQR